MKTIIAILMACCVACGQDSGALKGDADMNYSGVFDSQGKIYLVGPCSIYTKADAEEIVEALDLATASNNFLYQFYMASIQAFGDNEEIKDNAERCRAAGLLIGIQRDKWRKRLEELK